jgi:hypothetical protein
MCGICPVEGDVAYKVINYSPITNKDIRHASATVKTRSGEISSSWVYEGDKIRYTLTLPDGVIARVNIDGKACEVGAGVHTFWGDAK